MLREDPEPLAIRPCLDEPMARVVPYRWLVAVRQSILRLCHRNSAESWANHCLRGIVLQQEPVHTCTELGMGACLEGAEALLELHLIPRAPEEYLH